MALVWGVYPLLVPEFTTIDEMIAVISKTAYKASLVDKGDLIIIIAGVPFGIGGQTNLLKIHKVEDVD
jgi:pyruvate kinase